jgi:hypothetical protein
MLTVQAVIQTKRADEYLRRVCEHAGKMGQGVGHRRRHGGGDGPPRVRQSEWSGTRGTGSLDCGQFTMQADCDALTVRAEAADEASLRRIQDLLAVRLENFGSREGLRVSWTRTGRPVAGSSLPSRRPRPDA